MVFTWSLSCSKSPQVSITLFSILAHLNTLIWMVSILPLISISSSLSFKIFGIIPNAPITIGITITHIFHGFFIIWQGLNICQSFHFYFHSTIGWNSKIQLTRSSLFFFFWLVNDRCGLVVETRGSVYIVLFLPFYNHSLQCFLGDVFLLYW